MSINFHRKLLEFWLKGESGILCDVKIFDVLLPMTGLGSLSGYCLSGGRSSSFLYSLPLQLLFDTQTYCFWKLPDFHPALVSYDKTNVYNYVMTCYFY